MTQYTDWKNNATYSFSTTPTAKLPTRYDLVKLTGIVAYTAAKRIAGNDLYAMWRAIYPNLPEGTPDTPENSTWLVFESQTKEPIVLANDWINGGTVDATDYTQATVVVTDTSQEQMMVLRDFMNKLKMKYVIKFG